MIFNILRRFLRDDEFERSQLQLEESQQLLEDYKEFLRRQREDVQKEADKVEVDFLILVWASVGIAFGTVGSSVPVLNDLIEKRNTDFYVWLCFGVFAFLFAVFNSMFALRLTEQYARAKSDEGYFAYAIWLVSGAAVLALGIVVLFFFGKH